MGDGGSRQTVDGRDPCCSAGVILCRIGRLRPSLGFSVGLHQDVEPDANNHVGRERKGDSRAGKAESTDE